MARYLRPGCSGGGKEVGRTAHGLTAVKARRTVGVSSGLATHWSRRRWPRVQVQRKKGGHASLRRTTAPLRIQRHRQTPQHSRCVAWRRMSGRRPVHPGPMSDSQLVPQSKCRIAREDGEVVGPMTGSGARGYPGSGATTCNRDLHHVLIERQSRFLAPRTR
jgi:hypothetical protein